MGKTKKSYSNTEYDEQEDEYGLRMHMEKQARHHNRLVDQALKTKNIDKLYELEEYEEEEDLNYYGNYEEEDYVVCNGCSKVLISEEDNKTKTTFIMNGEPEYYCIECMKKEQDNS